MPTSWLLSLNPACDVIDLNKLHVLCTFRSHYQKCWHFRHRGCHFCYAMAWNCHYQKMQAFQTSWLPLFLCNGLDWFQYSFDCYCFACLPCWFLTSNSACIFLEVLHSNFTCCIISWFFGIILKRLGCTQHGKE